MKNPKIKILAVATLLIAFSTNSFAQQTATSSDATATTVIVSSITITKSTDMNFGNVVASAAGGTVILATDATLTPNGVTVLGTTATAASFNVTGDDNFTYYVTLPADNAVTLAKSGATAMALTGFTDNSTHSFTSGAGTFSVGATLHVGANQAAGTYVSSAFDVQVTYN